MRYTFKLFPKITFVLRLVAHYFSFIEQHIAAASGNEHCVVLLLEFGANPNAKGMVL